MWHTSLIMTLIKRRTHMCDKSDHVPHAHASQLETQHEDLLAYAAAFEHHAK